MVATGQGGESVTNRGFVANRRGERWGSAVPEHVTPYQAAPVVAADSGPAAQVRDDEQAPSPLRRRVVDTVGPCRCAGVGNGDANRRGPPADLDREESVMS